MLSRSLILVLLCVEIIAISINFDAQSLIKTQYALLSVIRFTGEFMKFSFAVAGAFCIFAWPRFKEISPILAEYTYHPSWKNWLFAHAALLAFFVYLTSILLSEISFENSHGPIMVNLAVLSWVFLGICSVTFLLFSITPFSCWYRLVKQEIGLFLVSILAGALSWGAGELAELSWQPLVEQTFRLSYFLLNIVYPEVVFEPANKILGTPSFQVEISPQCSGYEGIGLVIMFLSLYMWTFRNNLRFPNAYILIPIGVITIWLLNTFRIVALISIGSSYSSNIAAGGFHSNAGWIAFVIISVGLILLCQRITFFKTEAHYHPTDSNNASLAFSLLVPFVALLATILLTTAFTVDFD